MSKTKIEWAEMSWNPTSGCDKISQGCKNCYACGMAKRLKAMGQYKYRNEFELTLHESELKRPYTWKKPVKVFVNSMSDLFHKDVPIEFIQKVFKVMNETPHITYQVLTKRAKLLYEYDQKGLLNWTDNIWMGVSVENKDVLDRIDFLRQTGAKVKFLSCEPLLDDLGKLDLTRIDQCLVGGESGKGARPIKKEWVLNIKRQCQEQGTAFFFKQWGMKKFNPDQSDPTMFKNHEEYSKGGCQLDGIIYREFPIFKIAA
jgi:protein gp37